MTAVPGSDSGRQLDARAVHDLNNLLGTILLYSELLLEEMDAADPRYSDVKVIHQACEGAREFVRNLPAGSLCPACATPLTAPEP